MMMRHHARDTKCLYQESGLAEDLNSYDFYDVLWNRVQVVNN